MPGQRLDIEFTLEVDADVLCATPNQVSVFGRGLDLDLDPLGKDANDLSDSGDNPLTSNPGQPGDTGGCDDPTPLELPSIHVTKMVQSATMVADPTG